MELYSHYQRTLRDSFLRIRRIISNTNNVRNFSLFERIRPRPTYWSCPSSAKFNRHMSKSNVLLRPGSKKPMFSNCLSSSCIHYSPILNGEVDRFGGLHIDIQQQISNQSLLISHDVLRKSLIETVSQCKIDQHTTNIWLEVPAKFGHVIPIAAEAGFTFHHAEGNQAVMYQWLGSGESKIPDYATHQIGVSGFVLDEESGKVLMIQDKHRIARWKFPGGYSKLGEDISETAIREVFEETSVKTEFQSILAFRQQHHMPYSFDRSDIYVVCRLKPVTFDLTICSDELMDAKWMHINVLLTSQEHTPLTKQVARLAEQGLQESFDDVDITMSELPSVYKGKTYKLFCRSHMVDTTSLDKK